MLTFRASDIGAVQIMSSFCHQNLDEGAKGHNHTWSSWLEATWILQQYPHLHTVR